MSYDAVAVMKEEQHLGIPIIRAKGAMMKQYGPSVLWASVLVLQRDTVSGRYLPVCISAIQETPELGLWFSPALVGGCCGKIMAFAR
jgi:hypothetical protein